MSTVASTTNQTRTTCGRLAGRCDFGDGVGHGPQFPVARGPVGGVARVVVHVVMSPGVGKLHGGSPGDGREGGFPWGVGEEE